MMDQLQQEILFSVIFLMHTLDIYRQNTEQDLSLMH